MSGLHRTYIGQIERGEKNISFANLLKVSGVLDVTMSELLAALEDSTWPERDRPGRASGGEGRRLRASDVRGSPAHQAPETPEGRDGSHG